MMYVPEHRLQLLLKDTWCANKRMSFGVRQKWVQILVLSFITYVTLKSIHFISLNHSFIIYKKRENTYLEAYEE